MISAATAILQQLASEQRRVVSDWRALILLRRATITTPAAERRWDQMPGSVQDVRVTLRRMQARGEIAPIPRLRYIFQVTVPYAQLSPLSEDEILMEVHPYAALSHFSALAFHALTPALPQEMIATIARDERGGMYPAGTSPEDWSGLELVRGRKEPYILNQRVRWITVKPAYYFGVYDYQPRGYPVRVTSPERTLLDGLREPELCGGIGNVLAAWAIAADTLDLELLAHQVDRFNIAVLRQRVGFILETLNIQHPMMDRWHAVANRGGSSKLLASAPYSDTYSERWNLSINAPIDALLDALPESVR